MSSYTSNSNNHRSYVLGLLAIVLIPVSALLSLGVYLQPLYGDLTRIGSFEEVNFGWNMPQLTFSHTGLKFPSSMAESGQYGSYHDVVVLGDSFSWIRPETQWQNYLAASTGWSIASLNIGKISLKQILASKVFREHPPRVLIVESVERYLPIKLKDNIAVYDKTSTSYLNKKIGDDETQALTSSIQLTDQSPGATQLVERESLWGKIQLGFVWNYIWNKLMQQLESKAQSEVYKVSLTKSGLFSSREQFSMLVYHGDIQKVASWKDVGLAEMKKNIEDIKRQVEANRYTRFVLMVPPDKLTAYSDFVDDKGFQVISSLAELSSQLPKVIPRLDLALTSSIREGKQDVYLPDDTHWGSSGNQIAADTLRIFLQKP